MRTSISSAETTGDDKALRRREKLTAFIRQEAAAQGFDLCRITLPTSIPRAPERLSTFLDDSHHGTMDWMAETKERRADPKTLWARCGRS